MKAMIARRMSFILSTSAAIFAVVLKPFMGSPEVPQELKK